jgi:hypothetical protein
MVQEIYDYLLMLEGICVKLQYKVHPSVAQNRNGDGFS